MRPTKYTVALGKCDPLILFDPLLYADDPLLYADDPLLYADDPLGLNVTGPKLRQITPQPRNSHRLI